MSRFLRARGRHVRPVRRRTAAAVAVTSAAGLALVLPPTTAVSAATVPAECRQPVVRDVMVSQGLPSYASLARGKTALVKLFLSEPSSANCGNVTSESISVTGGSLRVDAGGTVSSVSLDVPPEGALPEFSGYNVAPVTSTPADPRFVVPGSMLTSSSLDAFGVTFTGTLDYVVKDRSGVVLSTGRLPVTKRPDGSAITATVAKPAKPLRLLVVPMGNADVANPEQFPPAAATEVSAGMAAVSRQLPIADGVGPLTGTAGLRWQLSAGMVHLGPHIEIDPKTRLPRTVDYMPNGTLCGGGGAQFTYISDQLAQFRAAWNAEHPTTPVDRVLGVIWQGVSVGAQTGNGTGCAEGYAGIGGTVAWSRIVTGTAPKLGVTGSIATLELTHGFGGSIVDVRQAASGPVAGDQFPHSNSIVADRTAPNRAYNVSERAFLDASKNRSVSSYDLAPYDDYTTLYEKADWEFVACVLASSSPTASKDCGSPISTSSAVAAAGGSYVLAGSTDGTVAGTDAHTYFDEDAPRDGVDAASTYRLVQRSSTGATLGASTGLRVTEAHSEHDDGGSAQVHDDRLAFNLAIAQQQGATAFELWKGEPGTSGSLLLYRRSLDGQAPVITETATAPAPLAATRFTSDAVSSQPAVSKDGRLVALTTPAGVVVARAGDASIRSSAVPGTQAAWDPSGSRIAIVRSGEVFLVPVTAAGTGAPVLGTPTKVYGSRAAGLAPVASRPSFSPDGSELAVAVNGDLFAINLGLLTPEAYPVLCQLDALVQDASTQPSGLGCRRLTATPEAEAAPAWSVQSGVLAYERIGRIWTLDPAAPGSTQVSRLTPPTGAYSTPAWSGTRLVAARGSGLFSVDADSYGGLSEVTAIAGDTWPSGSSEGDQLVFARPAGSGSDLWSVSLVRQGATSTVKDDHPAEVRLDLYVVCAGSADPVVVAARPSSVDEQAGEAYFDLRFDRSRVCEDGQLLYRATDGYSVDRRLGDNVAGAGTARAAISLPKPGAVLHQFDNLAISGAGTGETGAATSSLTWTLTGPNAYSANLGTGTTLPDVVPPAGGWTAGTWTVTATPDGDPAGAMRRVFTIVGDADADGIPDTRDLKAVFGCYPTDAVSNAENALADYDNDLVPSLLDPSPCVSALNGSAVFNPETLNLVSTGNPITITLTTSALDVRTLKVPDVRIDQVGGFDAAIPAYALAVLSPSRIEAKFDRKTFIEFFNSKGLRGYVPVVINATKGAVTARGFDTSAPLYQPS